MRTAANVALSAPLPRYWPGQDGARSGERPVRRWRVLHACEGVARAAKVAEAQTQAGMRPSLLTPQGWYRPGDAPEETAAPLSLIQQFHRVWQWRKRFASETVDQWAEILHAHCAPAAMPALHGSSALVYDLTASIGAGGAPKSEVWLRHSLCAAEHFVLSRAAAVVVHSHTRWSEAQRRGVGSEDLFLVPDPVDTTDCDDPARRDHRAAITIFAPVSGGDAALLLQAIAMVASEIPDVRLVLEVAASERDTVLAQAAEAAVAHRVEVIDASRHAEAMAAAEIIVAGVPADGSPNPVMISALAHRRAILAVDVAANREVAPQGQGCLWYRKDDAADLAGRAAFLARNPDFRAALGASGRAHLEATRSPRAVAQKYDQVYRHAFQRRHRGNWDTLRKLEIVQACF